MLRTNGVRGIFLFSQPGSGPLITSSSFSTFSSFFPQSSPSPSSPPSSASPCPNYVLHSGFRPRPRAYDSRLGLQSRGKKTKSTINLQDLPQGTLPVDPLPLEEAQDEPAYPTVVLQARRNMQKFDNCVLLTRVGGFYELYFEHAEEYGPLLNLKVASKKTSAGPVPMVSNQPFLPHLLSTLAQIY